MKRRDDELTAEQAEALAEALPEMRKLARRIARRCPHVRLEDIETMVEDLFIPRVRRWTPAEGKLVEKGARDVTVDVLSAVYKGADFGAMFRAAVAEQDEIIAPDIGTRWTESLEAKHERALAMGSALAEAGASGFAVARAARSPEDEYADREGFEVMKRTASGVHPRGAELLELLYARDATWEEAAMQLSLDMKQAQRIEAKVFVRLRAILGVRNQEQRAV